MSFLKSNNSDYRDRRIQRLFVIGCMVYVSLGFSLQMVQVEYYDPFWMRFLVGSLGLAAIILSQISNFFKKYFSTTLLITMLIYNAHVYYLLYMNDFEASYRTSLLAVVITTIIFLNSKRIHLIYNVLNIAAFTFLMIYSDNLDKANIHLGMLLTIVLVFGYLKNSDSLDAYQIMKTNQNLLNTVNNNIFNGIFRIDLNYNLLYANDYLVHMLGLGISDDRYVVEEVKKLFANNNYLTDQIRQRKWVKDHEFKLIRKDGTDFWGLLSISPVFDENFGELASYDGTIVDITDKKMAENELMLFSAAIDHTPTGVVITNKFGRITYANPYFTKLTGFTVDEVMGTKLEQYGVMDEPVHAHAWKQLTSGQIWKGELNFKNKSGNILTELISVAPMKNDKGEISNFVMVTEDITERKRTETEILLAKEQAENATRAKESFLSTMSHELRTPMNSVIGISNLLLEENPREDQAENLHILKFSANNLLAIINDILDLSKIEAGRMELADEDFDLHYALINIKRTHAIKAQEKGVQVKLQVDEMLPGILKGDPHRLNQILNNLVSNAVKFTENGHVQIQVDIVAELRDVVQVRIAVEDTGIGIPTDKIDAVFESFRQASSETSRKYGGTGLGLAITKKLVEIMDGTIRVESNPGSGSRFIVQLPFKKGNAQFRSTQMEPPVNNSTKLGGVRVLLVDDNPINQKVAKKFLAKWETHVTLADNGKEAVEKVNEGIFDVILMDLHMPEMDGMEATRLIRAMDDPYKKLIPVVALTAAAMNHEKEQAELAGMCDYVCKPFVPEELFNKLLRYSLKAKEIQRGLKINNSGLPAKPAVSPNPDPGTRNGNPVA